MIQPYFWGVVTSGRGRLTSHGLDDFFFGFFEKWMLIKPCELCIIGLLIVEFWYKHQTKPIHKKMQRNTNKNIVRSTSSGMTIVTIGHGKVTETRSQRRWKFPQRFPASPVTAQKQGISLGAPKLKTISSMNGMKVSPAVRNLSETALFFHDLLYTCLLFENSHV